MNRVKLFFEDLTFSTRYDFLEVGKDDDEISRIAKKHNLVYPCRDIAIFKGRYAVVDKENRNHCTLPKEEVEKALNTLTGKPVDIDHVRRKAIGYWLEGHLEDDEIISYGAYWKNAFSDEYEGMKEKMKEGKVKISFEAWGDREMKEDGSYDLLNIEFAGGALLDEEDPAEPTAEVFELARSGKVLEFAKVIEKAYVCSCVECGEVVDSGDKHCKDLKCPKCGGQMRRKERPGPGQGNSEEARYYLYDTENILRLVSQVKCPNCENEGCFDVGEIDFEKNRTRVTCVFCESILAIDLTPTSKLTKKGRKIDKVGVETRGSVLEDKFIDRLLKAKNDEESFEIISDFEGVVEKASKLSYSERNKLSDNNFAVVKSVGNKTGETKKIRMFPIHNPAHVESALIKLNLDKVQSALNKLGVSKDSVKEKIINRAKELNMKELLKKYEEASVEEQSKMFKELASQLDEVKLALEEAKTTLATKEEELKKASEELDIVKKEADEAKAEIAKIAEEAKQKLVAERREQLGEFAKEMSDEQVLDEKDFAIALKDKEIAELKAGKVEEKKEDDTKADVDLDKGSKDKKDIDENMQVGNRVLEKAYGKANN